MDVEICWYDSVAAAMLVIPPLSAIRGAQEGDLFIHKYGSKDRIEKQVWRWERIVGTEDLSWVPLEVGDARQIIADEDPRRFVLTNEGQPSWVKAKTLNRFYPPRP